jgi:IclR family acetate operon transcriptional repressor
MLMRTRADGYAADLDAAAIGVACIGTAIAVNGQVAGAISVSAPRARMPDERVASTGRLLQAAASEIAGRLAVRP